MVIGILFLVGALIIYGLWARVISHLASLHKKWLWVHIFLIGIFSTLLVKYFPKLIAFLGINNEKFINNLNIPTVLSYSVYMITLGIIVYICYVRRIRKKGYFYKILIFITFFTTILVVGVFAKIPNYILYFSIVAFIEEFIKYVFGYSLFDKYKIHYTDLILFCLISSFGFALVENGVYAYYNLQKLEIQGLLPKLFSIGKTLTQRGFINISVHTLFTGLIGFLTLSPIIKNKTTDKTKVDNGKGIEKTLDNEKVSLSFGKIIFGILLGVGIHTVFNISTSTGIFFVLPIVVLGGYVFLSYLFYKSDSFFAKPNKK